MLTLRCECGEIYHADERHIGRRIKCKKCDQIIPIEHPDARSPSPELTPDRTYAPTSQESWSKALDHRVLIVAGAIILAILLFVFNLRGPGDFSSDRDQSLPSSSPTVTTEPRKEIQPPIPRPKRSPVSLPSGTDIISSQGLLGFGTLKIINGTGRDAVVKLVNNTVRRRTYRFVYVKAHDETTTKNIGPGSYLLRFAFGIDWDLNLRKFLQKRSYAQFVNAFEFEQVETRSGVRHRKIEVTLHPVLGGKTRTTSIDEDTFNESDPVPLLGPLKIEEG